MQVQFSVEKSTFHLLVDGARVTDGHLANDEGSSLDLHDLVYLGGDPGRNTKVCSKTCFTPRLQTFSHMCTRQEPFVLCAVHQGHNVPMNSIIGCVRNVEINEEVLREPEASHKTPPCFNTPAEMGTYFDGGYVISGSETLHITGGCEPIRGYNELLCSRPTPLRWIPVCVGL